MDQASWAAVLDYIDGHLEESATVAQVAAAAGYSAFHFNRVFARHMGIPLMEYMRMRRLQHAAARVVAGDRLLDIAIRFGFSSHEGFTRAFRRQYGISPKGFRRVHAGSYRIPPHHTRHGVSKGEGTMKPYRETWKDRMMVGYLLHTQPGAAKIPAFWNEVMADARWQALTGIARRGSIHYGLCIHPASMPEGRMDYMIAVEYDGISPLEAGMTSHALEGTTYMVFPVSVRDGDDTAGQIKRCWTEIYTQWLPSSGCACDEGRPDFEAYRPDGSVYIYIPIVDRGT